MAIWRNLLSLQNKAISVDAMRIKESWLVQENHVSIKFNSRVASRKMKTHSESKTELRNLQFLKNIL